jgi:beta-N-acetylhexosaminidase
MLSLEEKIGQMVMVGFHGLEPPQHILNWLADGYIGGVILFARNVDSPAQIAELTQACHEAAKKPILIAIDQEGGVVARLRQGFTESPGAMALGAANSEGLAEEISTVLGAEMRALGINWNLAPALDLTHNIENPSVGVRSLGVDPEQVKKLGVAQVRGFQKAGVAATAKHFPGKANTPVDPHVELPVIDGSVDEMWEADLIPFQAVSEAGIAAMLITHVQFTALEPEHPSTLSPAIIQGLLREKIGFSGVVSTDCMEMGAVTKKYGAGESAVLAALAGASTILFSHTLERQQAAHDALLDAARSGRLPMETIDFAVDKILAMKDQFAITAPPAPEVIRQPAHLEIAAKTAHAGVVLVQSEADVLPLKLNDSRHIALIEFASYLDTEALEESGLTGMATLLREQLPQIDVVGLSPADPSEELVAQARDLAANSDVIVIATRNAHLNAQQCELVQELLTSAQKAILICLRNPYDAGVLTGAGTVLCTCSDGEPSLTAAIEVLTGHFTPTATLPVPLVID